MDSISVHPYHLLLAWKMGHIAASIIFVKIISAIWQPSLIHWFESQKQENEKNATEEFIKHTNIGSMAEYHLCMGGCRRAVTSQLKHMQHFYLPQRSAQTPSLVVSPSPEIITIDFWRLLISGTWFEIYRFAIYYYWLVHHNSVSSHYS